MLTVTLLVCAMMALVKAGDVEINDTLPVEIGVFGNNTFPVLVAAAGCSDGWTEYGGRCFFLDATPRSWAKAQKNCQSMGGNLASVHNHKEYVRLQSLSNSAETWIGGTGCQQSSYWFWSDGSRLSYTFWCSGQPDNTLEDCCLKMNTGTDKCWDDISCLTELQSICVKTP